MFTVRQGSFSGGDWRLEIGHGDGSAELLGGVSEDGGGGGSIAEVVVEVVGEG